MQLPQMCGSLYAMHECTFRAGHDSVHSWKWLKDEIERLDAQRPVGGDDTTPSDVQALLDAITAGNADPYLEAILAVTHNRKRALRGVRGFGRLDHGR